MPPERVYIVGFMGSGKTTAGRKLASGLGWTFIDLDKRIEEKAGMTIPEIFSQLGEEHFRLKETEILRELGEVKNAVISTGGGAPCHDDNMNFMLSSGITIFLKLSPEQLSSRLIHSKTERPLIKGLSQEELLKFIKDKLSSREQYYNRAEIIIEGCDPDLEALEKIISGKAG